MTTPISRRTLLALAGAAAACPPALAHFPGKRSRLVTTTTDLGRRVSAQVFMPGDADGPLPAVMVVHDRAGLAATIRWFNAEMGRRGFLAVAPNLYEGEPSPPAAMSALDPTATLDALRSWLRWQKAHFRSNGHVGVVAFGEGAVWAARAAVGESVAGLACCCSSLGDPAFAEAARRSDILAHLSTPDQGTQSQRVAELEAISATAGHRLTAYWYDARLGFTDFLGNTYDKASDALVIARTTDFFAEASQ